MNSYELLQALDKKYGKKSNPDLKVDITALSTLIANVSPERCKQAQKNMAKILHEKEKTEHTSSLKVESIHVDDLKESPVKEDKDGDER